MCLNFLIDLIPNNIGIIAAWRWANNKIEKNKINSQTQLSLNLKTKNMFSYLRRDRYHCPITMINIVRTKGKAGYFVWKLAGGQGDQDINLPWGSFEITFFLDFLDIKLSVANPLLINQIKSSLTKTYQKGVYIILFNLSCFLLERRGWDSNPRCPCRHASFQD